MIGVKTEARSHFRLIRLAMKHQEVALKSQAICAKLPTEIEKLQIKTLLAYRPISKLHEVDIKPFLDELKNIEVDLLATNPAQRLPDKKYDTILVPCLAFDKANFRLGWGGGFYDRLLAEQTQAIKIGLCYQNGFAKDGLPREPHDIPLNKILTEV
jgi:5-formyltetrahydrofolate cyclo-ligase